MSKQIAILLPLINTKYCLWKLIIINFLADIYYQGGVKAVVYADVIQTLLMFGGVLAVVVTCCQDLGGIGNVWTIAQRGGRISFFE